MMLNLIITIIVNSSYCYLIKRFGIVTEGSIIVIIDYATIVCYCVLYLVLLLFKAVSQEGFLSFKSFLLKVNY